MQHDQQLLERAASGDEAAAAELFDRHASVCLRFLTFLLGDAHAAEDVLQDTFLSLLRRAREYDPQRASVGTWLRRIALNLARNELRRRSRKAALSLDTPLPAQNGELLPVSEHLVDRDSANVRERVALALEILARLSEEDREILVLRYIEGLPPREIAEVLGISPKAASMRIWRSVKELQCILQKDRESS